MALGTDLRPEKQLTCLSPGKKLRQTTYPHSIVRMHAVLLLFQIFNVPLLAEAITWSSAEIARQRTSCRWPGSSIE
jgi:hypothetical protein